MRVLIACEFSGIVRDAFRARGHVAWSCDRLASETDGQHIEGNVLTVLHMRWDMMIAFPPCTHLASSGARWFKDKAADQMQAIDFVRRLMAAPIDRIAIENPIGVLSTRIRKPDQIIQPWQFGHGLRYAWQGPTAVFPSIMAWWLAMHTRLPSVDNLRRLQFWEVLEP